MQRQGKLKTFSRAKSSLLDRNFGNEPPAKNLYMNIEEEEDSSLKQIE